MSMTLLEVAQEIASSMDADEFNTIGETVESRQIVDSIQATWRDIQQYLELPQYDQLFSLTASGDTTRPTLMYIPDGVKRIDWIKYDNTLDISTGVGTARAWRLVRPLMRYEFFERMNSLDTTDTAVYQYSLVIGTGTFDIRGRNDFYPSYYTVINDRTVIFDNYPAAIDLTLVANKTEASGLVVPTFSRTDDWIVPLEDNALSHFVNEAKSQAFIDLKQVQNAKADQRARRALVMLGKNSDRSPAPEPAVAKAPNFGRHSRG